MLGQRLALFAPRRRILATDVVAVGQVTWLPQLLQHGTLVCDGYAWALRHLFLWRGAASVVFPQARVV